ncbi:MAG: hypothetical protein LIP77_02105, partial [Planctomycetes bacterium]|nr:hypothetical protein [Planctomycetota bacterium]
MSTGKHKKRATRPFMPLGGTRSTRRHRPTAAAEPEAADTAVATDGAAETGTTPPAAEAPAPAPATVAQAEFDAVAAERDSYLDMARRERADFDNYRKRMQRDMEQLK